VATTLPMPLFTRYAERSGEGAGALALAFVCYAATLIVTAPLLGSLSDRLGRRPCVMAGLAFAGAATLALTVAPGLGALALARALQGLAIGLVAGAATAWAAELAGGAADAARRAAGVVALGTAGSFAVGGLLTLGALEMQDGAEPPATYGLHLLAVAAALLAVARLPETHAADRAAPWLRLPAFPRGTLATSLAIVPAWGVTGTALTSVPVALAAQGMPRLGPVAVCLMILVGVVVQQALGRAGLRPRRAVPLGLSVLVAGAGLMAWGTLAGGALAPLLAGGALVGSAAYGFIYLGGLAAAAQEAAPAERAGAAAGFFLLAHLGFALPPLLVGLAVDRFGAAMALSGLWLGVAALAAALAVAIRRAEAGDAGRA
jgi:MFS family permease